MRAVPRPGRYLRPAAAVAVLLLLAWPVSASWGHASRLVAGTRDQLSATPPPATERVAPAAVAPAAEPSSPPDATPTPAGPEAAPGGAAGTGETPGATPAG
jgi:hypothetical protein